MKVWHHWHLFVIVMWLIRKQRQYVVRYVRHVDTIVGRIFDTFKCLTFTSFHTHTQLREVLPRQQFVTVIQAKADGKIIASERIQAYRKDVLTKSGKTVGGGDQTRKMKLLEKQKKGKERMQQTGRVSLSQEAFNSVISRSS
jgi:translation elongation factor EF-4